MAFLGIIIWKSSWNSKSQTFKRWSTWMESTAGRPYIFFITESWNIFPPPPKFNFYRYPKMAPNRKRKNFKLPTIEHLRDYGYIPMRCSIQLTSINMVNPTFPTRGQHGIVMPRGANLRGEVPGWNANVRIFHARDPPASKMGVSLNGGTPISHPQVLSIFSRKTHSCWVAAF